MILSSFEEAFSSKRNEGYGRQGLAVIEETVIRSIIENTRDKSFEQSTFGIHHATLPSLL